jgi:hypothetical protein
MKAAGIAELHGFFWIFRQEGKKFIPAGFYFCVIRKGRIRFQISEGCKMQFQYIITERVIKSRKNVCTFGVLRVTDINNPLGE